MVSLVSPNYPWFVLAPKCSNYTPWLVLCRPVWVSEACQFFLIPSRSSNMPFYPSKVLWTKEHAPTLCAFTIFYLGLTFESLKELGVSLQPIIHFKIQLQLSHWRLELTYRKRFFTFSPHHTRRQADIVITKNSFWTLTNVVIINATCTNLVQRVSTMTMHAKIVATQDKVRSYTKWMLRNDFIPLAIETYGCLHFHFDSFLISCVHACIICH